MIVTLAIAGAVSWQVTGSLVPREPGSSLVFQSGLLLVVLGSTIIEQNFTKPAEAAVNAVAALVSLVTVYNLAPTSLWYLVAGYATAVLVISLICVVASEGAEVAGLRRRVAGTTYELASFFGRARLIHSVVFLFGVFSFYDRSSRETAILVLFWGLFVVLWPLGVPGLLTRIGRRLTFESMPSSGEVLRREWPGLLRVRLHPRANWAENEPYVHCDADGAHFAVVPLYKTSRSDHSLATALEVAVDCSPIAELTPGQIYRPDLVGVDIPTVSSLLGAGDGQRLIGFVVEDSSIGAIRFETWRHDLCREGALVTAAVGEQEVAYQITRGVTREESLDTDRLGSQVAEATQIGRLGAGGAITNFGWLPRVNTPVFLSSTDFGEDSDVPDGDFAYGVVPGTQRAVTGDFVDGLTYHTAVLGVTGSGKTETAFRMIRHCVDRGVKVIAIDLTSQYAERLQDLSPVSLSLSAEVSAELGAALFAVETGTYGAGPEKAALAKRRDALYADIEIRLRDFLHTEAGSDLGLISLPEISNTQATLVITELFMSALLNLGRHTPELFERVLVVVEEAHTVMPEANTMGLGDYTSRGLVSKIAQIALQGRKYGVGLLVLAQRTATVTKTVLTQCNTVVAFGCFDETSRAFLAGVFGARHADALRDLGPLQAVVFGKGLRSQRPVIVQTPYDPDLDPTGAYRP